MNNLESNREKIDDEGRTTNQEAILLDLNRFNINFYIFGGWAGKIDGVFGDEYHPSDIDIMVQDSDYQRLGERLKTIGFDIKDVPELNKKIATKGDVAIDIHFVREEDGYLKEETPRGIFYFPVSGFDSRDWKGLQLKTMSPELSVIIESGGRAREGREQKLEKLRAKTDESRMRRLNQDFKYKPI